MKHKIDLKNYKRKAQFEFFQQHDDPIWSITAEVDCTATYKTAKEKKHSFFLSYLHKSLKAAYDTEEFRYRVENGTIYCYHNLIGSATIAKKDDTFGFSYFTYEENFENFSRKAIAEIEKVKSENILRPTINNENVIHYSTVPWLSFTTVEIPKLNPREDFIPKIIFGKAHNQGGTMKMPVAVFVNHILIDAVHVSKYFEKFQQLLNLGK